MTKAKRLLAAFATAVMVAAVPAAASAQEIGECVAPGTEPVVYVCVDHDPVYGTGILIRVDDTKYNLGHDGEGFYFCINRNGTTSCPVPS